MGVLEPLGEHCPIFTPDEQHQNLQRVEDHEDKKAEEVDEEAPVEEEVQEEEAQEEEEEAGERTLGSILKPGVTTVEQFLQFLHPHTPAYNPHFPNTNQTKHCWSSYINYTQCTKLKGE